MSRNFWLALVVTMAVGVCASVATMAQDDGSGGPGGAGGAGGRRSSGGPGGMGGGGAPASMVAHKDHLYILMGPRLVKVDPETMKVVAELELAGGPGGGGGSRRGPKPGGEEGGGEPK